MTPLVAPLGYEIVTIELLTHKQKTLRIFIDFAETPKADAKGEIPLIGIEDCVKVARALDEPLDLIPEVETAFQSTYELEVSSPGVDRPLRQAKDFERFQRTPNPRSHLSSSERRGDRKRGVCGEKS